MVFGKIGCCVIFFYYFWFIVLFLTCQLPLYNSCQYTSIITTQTSNHCAFFFDGCRITCGNSKFFFFFKVKLANEIFFYRKKKLLENQFLRERPLNLQHQVWERHFNMINTRTKNNEFYWRKEHCIFNIFATFHPICFNVFNNYFRNIVLWITNIYFYDHLNF